MANAASASTALVCRAPQLFSSTCTCRNFPLRRRWSIKTGGGRIYASVSAGTHSPTRPDDLVVSIVSKVMQADRGVLLTRDENQKVAEMATDLQRFCVNEPVKCPLIFGGKLTALDEKWIQVVFEPPELKVGGLEFTYGWGERCEAGDYIHR